MILTLNLDKSYNDINSIKQLPIKKTGNKVILLSDVANIEFGPVSEKTLFKSQTKDQDKLERQLELGFMQEVVLQQLSFQMILRKK